ncbi:acetyl-CoA carboxylase biotin carboxyl carrier protein subunit [Nonomuraea dietziae]|uniref:acetyl-CoA carboxylase biotin carboxyl carrier protein subunit n=1 Tax=Nonomuraea dietziae TaxID=65515 RepID=UPI0033FFF8D7
MSVLSPLRGTVVSVEVTQGDLVRQGAPIAIVESMKMEHVVEAPQAGIVGRVAVGPGDTVAEGALLVHLDPVPAAADVVSEAAEIDLESVRPDSPR